MDVVVAQFQSVDLGHLRRICLLFYVLEFMFVDSWL